MLVVSVAASVATDLASETTTLAATPITILVDTVCPNSSYHNRCTHHYPIEDTATITVEFSTGSVSNYHYQLTKTEQQEVFSNSSCTTCRISGTTYTADPLHPDTIDCNN